MARAKQLPRVHRYSLEFKLSAVRLSELADVCVQQIATALDIHPFMISRWRKQVRDGIGCTAPTNYGSPTSPTSKSSRTGVTSRR